jgi:PglZ domain
MTALGPTFSQIKAQVAAIRRKLPDARVIGICAPGRWTGERMKQDGGETYVIEQCDSPLAMRIALREDGESTATKVLITNLDARELSDDILVRLVKRQLFAVDSWQIIKSLFQAHAIDPRLTRHRWVADFLMEFIPAGGYPAVSGGFLDAETVWPILLGRAIGLTDERPDLLTILRWSIESTAVARYRAESSEFREAAVSWLSETAGPAANAVFRCIAANERADALPIGLAAGVVYNSKARGKLEKAAGKMEERFLGRTTPDETAIERWSAAATEVIRLQITDPRVKGSLLQRADEILTAVGAEGFAHLSLTSSLGFAQRLARFGEVLAHSLDGKGAGNLDDLAAAREQIGDHELAARERRRIERVDMAIRLVRWLGEVECKPQAVPCSLVVAADYELVEGGFVDWARLTLRTGDPIRELSEAYAKLFGRVTDLVEARSQEFAKLLRTWTEVNSKQHGLVPVERILEEFVAPLASQYPVLFLVLDGMSVAVCRELFSELVGHDWIPLNREGRGSLLSAGLATIPSVTEVSRTSLFCGQLKQGASADERLGFAEHPALRGHGGKSGYPPIVFHKSALRDQEDSILASEVRDEIASPNRQIVGVVINAIDDQLLKGEQLDTRWTRDSIPVLPALLHEAKASRRLVVITSDHGHVLDCNTTYQAREGGDRWRIDSDAPGEGELRFSGPRVVMPESKTVVVPWSEKVRYEMKKNGYHGGVAPQEMVVPIAVLCPSEKFPDGWVEVGVDVPSWWDESLADVSGSGATSGRARAAKQQQSRLSFDRAAESASGTEARTVAAAEAKWVVDLFRSPVFQQQKKLAERSGLSDEVFRAVLNALDQRGGKMTSGALSRAVNYPAMRLRGLLAVMQRVLNIDGFAVLTRDDASDTVDLNRELLRHQFGLR